MPRGRSTSRAAAHRRHGGTAKMLDVMADIFEDVEDCARLGGKGSSKSPPTAAAAAAAAGGERRQRRQ